MSYADFTLATLDHILSTLDHLVGKAEQAGEPDILDARLAPDMFALRTQVRMVTFQVCNCLNRLADAGLALDEADPEDFAAARAMIAKAREAVEATGADAFVDPGAPVEFDLPNGMEFALTAEEYARDWVLAQAYFHVTTFYAIARSEGVELGKGDFVGYMMRHLKKPASVA